MSTLDDSPGRTNSGSARPSAAPAAPHPRSPADDVPRLPEAEPADATEQEWREWIGRRNRRAARSVVRRAESILLERYGLEDLLAAFTLLKDASQQCNLKLHTVADAVVRVSGPESGCKDWFPGRDHPLPPPLNMLGSREVRRSAPQSEVLDAALGQMLRVAGADAGHVHLVEAGMRRLSRSTGLDEPFADYAAFTQGEEAAWDRAANEARQITVPAAPASDLFTRAASRAMAHNGTLACHCLPLASGHDEALAVMTAHYRRPLSDPLPRARLKTMEELGAQVGAWLSWHRHTVVLDALEYLHHRASED
ncbi:ANTAR domain protein [Streptomyces sp. YIM 130001]|uniref:ANTAR domain-containing protein n=1 Tax=Streptomyces sp. YIM 130001 TaxID=2259644 RepID=UPI000EDD2076|nr:ANTAR domain-containing protein [Streptomyces sp. YIM 130001]RII20416.1 ANTAR domain protein [Streptomyces sp. YIM 130001]